jgi:probable F420-dependent oxidoreductase
MPDHGATPRLGRLGIWSRQLRYADLGEARDAAAELESLGFGTLWLPGMGDDAFDRVEALLGATAAVTIATGIVSIWQHEAVAAAARFATLDERFVLGLGVSHAPLVTDAVYERPLRRMAAYLDALDSASPPVPAGRRMIAALGPRMLELARERSAGTHPYLVSTAHTRLARDILGRGPLLAPELTVILEPDPAAARAAARRFLSEPYLRLDNYRASWLRQGFSEADLEGGGSDRLVDAVIAWGDPEAVAARVAEHMDAGADHVCLQVLERDGTRGEHPPLAAWRELAAVLS